MWSPDGRSIAYLSYRPMGMWAEYEFVAEGGIKIDIRNVMSTWRLVLGGRVFGTAPTLAER